MNRRHPNEQSGIKESKVRARQQELTKNNNLVTSLTLFIPS